MRNLKFKTIGFIFILISAFIVYSAVNSASSQSLTRRLRTYSSDNISNTVVPLIVGNIEANPAGISNTPSAIKLVDLFPDLKAGEVNSVPILMYHNIKSNYAAEVAANHGHIDSNVTTSESFREQMRYLKDNNFYTTDIDTVMAANTKGKKLPANSVILTFDDGIRNYYSDAFPVLKEYKLRSTIFVVTDLIGQDLYLTWDMLKEINASNIVTIGSHTKSHQDLRSLSKTHLQAELMDSKKLLEDTLNIKITDFCYPSGAYNDKVLSAVKDAHYEAAVTTQYGKWKTNMALLTLPRVRINYGISLKAYKSLL